MGVGKIPLFTIVRNAENKGVQNRIKDPKKYIFFAFPLLNAYSQKKTENELKSHILNMVLTFLRILHKPMFPNSLKSQSRGCFFFHSLRITEMCSRIKVMGGDKAPHSYVQPIFYFSSMETSAILPCHLLFLFIQEMAHKYLPCAMQSTCQVLALQLLTKHRQTLLPRRLWVKFGYNLCAVWYNTLKHKVLQKHISSA